MANRWYATRELVKLALQLNTRQHDKLIDAYLEAASREIEDQLVHYSGVGIPVTETRNYTWPQRYSLRSWVIMLDKWLLAATALTHEGTDTTAIAAADYFLEPGNEPRAWRIEIDLSSTVALRSKNTPQRAIAVTGRWGWSEATKAGGTVRSNPLAIGATTLLVSNEALIGVGDTLLIESEAVFVSEKSAAAQENNDLLNGAVTADISDVTVTVDDGSRYNVGEVIQVDSEQMLIESISSNDLTVARGHNGTLVAAHNDDTAVFVFRTLTIVRGVNGTTAAAHVITTAISVYEPPGPVRDLCMALAEQRFVQHRQGWTGQIGTMEGVAESRFANLQQMKKEVAANYRFRTFGAV